MFSPSVGCPASCQVKQQKIIKYTSTIKHIAFLGQVYHKLANDNKGLSTAHETLRNLIFMASLRIQNTLSKI